MRYLSRIAILALAFQVLAIVSVDAQQPGPARRVGVLNIRPCPPRPAFVESLAKLGWTEGRTVTIDCISAYNRLSESPRLATELVARRPDVLVAGSTPAISALMAATSTIPIVMVSSGDPVRERFVTSLSRPGGNVTGLAEAIMEIQLKRLDLLKQMLPGISRLAAVSRSGGSDIYISGVKEQLDEAARKLGFTYELFYPGQRDDYAPLFSKIAAAKFDAVFLVPNPLASANVDLIGKLVRTHRLPTAAPRADFVEAGALFSLGIDLEYNLRRSAAYVDKILRGARPEDLPVELPSEFELVINMATAKALGIAVPQLLAVAATRIIDE